MNLREAFLNYCETNEFEINENQLNIIDDLKKGTKPLTLFISGPFGLRKGPRSEYGIDFKTKK